MSRVEADLHEQKLKTGRTRSPASPPGVLRWRFGPFEYDPVRRTLWRAAEVVPIQRLPARVLALLLEARGEIVLRETFLLEIWGGRRVGFDDRLNTAIAEVRRALGDSAGRPTYVETVRGRGYRFRAACRWAPTARRTWHRHLWTLVGRQRVAVGLLVAATLALGTLVRPFAQRSSGGPRTEAHAAARGLVAHAEGLLTSGRVADLREADRLLVRSLALDSAARDAHVARAVVAAMTAFEASEPDHLVRARRSLECAEAYGGAGPDLAGTRQLVAWVDSSAPPERWPPSLGSMVADRETLGWITRTVALRESGSGRELLDHLHAWSRAEPEASRPWAEMGAALHGAGRLAEAVGAYDTAIELAPDRPELYLRRAHVQLGLAIPPDEVISGIEGGRESTGMSAVYLLHMDPSLAERLGPHLEWRAADGSRFERAYDRAVFFLSRALVARASGEAALADTAFARSAALFEPMTRGPDSWSGLPDYQLFLAHAYAGLGRERDARRILEETRRRFPNGTPGTRAGYLHGLADTVGRMLAEGAPPGQRG